VGASAAGKAVFCREAVGFRVCGGEGLGVGLVRVGLEGRAWTLECNNTSLWAMVGRD